MIAYIIVVILSRCKPKYSIVVLSNNYLVNIGSRERCEDLGANPFMGLGADMHAYTPKPRCVAYSAKLRRICDPSRTYADFTHATLHIKTASRCDGCLWSVTDQIWRPSERQLSF